MPASAADEAAWVALANAAGFRLPRSDAKLTPATAKRAVTKAGLGLTDYLKWGGYKKVSDFADKNPDWSLREFQGLMLELRRDLG